MAYNGRSETSRSGLSGEANLRHASSLLQKKKQLHPIYNPNHPYRSSSYYGNNYMNNKSHVSQFTQRIMSAKLLRVKQLQNQLKESEIRIHELTNENRLLRTVQKRQDTALKKHEGAQAQLPQLIKSHNEELRVLTTKFKQLKANYRELESKLRQREMELSTLKEQHNHLLQLSRDKHLGVRERLAKQVDDLQYTVREQNERIQLLTRRVELEGKNNKHQLTLEKSRHRDTQIELTMALETIENLKGLVEAKEKCLNAKVPNHFYRPPAPPHHPQSSSTISINQLRFRNLPRTAAGTVLHKKTDREEAGSVVKIENSDHESDNLTHNSSNHTYSESKQIVESGANFRKRLAYRKSRSKVLLRSNIPLKVDQENVDHVENGTGTPPVYSSNFPSINTSDEITSKYNTSESETVHTKTNSIRKEKRRMSIDSVVTTGGNNSNNDSSDNVTKKEVLRKNRRKSVSGCESNDSTENDISESLSKAQAKDRLQRQKSIKDELQELEEKLKRHHEKYPVEKVDSLDSLYERKLLGIKTTESDDKEIETIYGQKSKSVKDELKEFEERLLHSDYNSSSIIENFEKHADEVVRKVTKELELPVFSDEDDNADEDKLRKKYGLPNISLQWNEMREQFRNKPDHTNTLLDKYYSTKNDVSNTDNGKGQEEEEEEEEEVDDEEQRDPNDDNAENDGNEEEGIEEEEEGPENPSEPDVLLDESAKVRLLEALQNIDKEGRTTGLRKSSRRNSFKFSDSNESVHEENKLFPVLENVNKHEQLQFHDFMSKKF